MALPSKPSCPTKMVTIEGEETLIRGLTRNEMHKLRDANDDLMLLDALLISCGCDVSVEDAKTWLETASQQAAEILVDGIMELSGLGDSPKD